MSARGTPGREAGRLRGHLDLEALWGVGKGANRRLRTRSMREAGHDGMPLVEDRGHELRLACMVPFEVDGTWRAVSGYAVVAGRAALTAAATLTDEDRQPIRLHHHEGRLYGPGPRGAEPWPEAFDGEWIGDDPAAAMACRLLGAYAGLPEPSRMWNRVVPEDLVWSPGALGRAPGRGATRSATVRFADLLPGVAPLRIEELEPAAFEAALAAFARVSSALSESFAWNGKCFLTRTAAPVICVRAGDTGRVRLVVEARPEKPRANEIACVAFRLAQREAAETLARRLTLSMPSATLETGTAPVEVHDASAFEDDALRERVAREQVAAVPGALRRARLPTLATGPAHAALLRAIEGEVLDRVASFAEVARRWRAVDATLGSTDPRSQVDAPDAATMRWRWRLHLARTAAGLAVEALAPTGTAADPAAATLDPIGLGLLHAAMEALVDLGGEGYAAAWRTFGTRIAILLGDPGAPGAVESARTAAGVLAATVPARFPSRRAAGLWAIDWRPALEAVRDGVAHEAAPVEVAGPAAEPEEVRPTPRLRRWIAAVDIEATADLAV